MAIVWDIGAIVLLALLVYLGAKKGLVQMLLSLASYAVAGVVAVVFSQRMANTLFDGYISEIIVQSVHSTLTQSLENNTGAISDWFGGLPSWFITAVKRLDPNIEQTIAQLMRDSIATRTDAIAIAVKDAIAAPVLLFMRWVCFLLLFLLVLVVFKLLIQFISSFNEVPVLGTANIAMGAVLGGFQAFIILVLLSVILHLLSITVFTQPGNMFYEASNNSFILGNLYKFLFAGTTG